MTDAAAFRACYADWKLIKTRSVVQIVLEIPVEQSGLAYEVLGGMPQPGKEIWCGVARLAETKESAQKPRPQDTDENPTERPGGAASKSWHEMPASQQAAILCGDAAFQRFLVEHYDGVMMDSEDAARVVRQLCNVHSRAELNTNNEAAMKWKGLVLDYRGWMRGAVA